MVTHLLTCEFIVSFFLSKFHLLNKAVERITSFVAIKLLLEQPVNIDCYIRNENAMKKFSDDGIPTKRSPLEVSESSDVIITMLPSSSHVSRLYLESTFLSVHS